MATKLEIQSSIENAIATMLAQQPTLIGSNNQTGTTEWNLGSHIAPVLHSIPIFSGFDRDSDVIKRNYGNKRPDIIFHSRNTNEYNFLVVELKFDRPAMELLEVEKRIRENWFKGELRYLYGAIINILRNGSYFIEVIENPDKRNIIHAPNSYMPI